MTLPVFFWIKDNSVSQSIEQTSVWVLGWEINSVSQGRVRPSDVQRHWRTISGKLYRGLGGH